MSSASHLFRSCLPLGLLAILLLGGCRSSVPNGADGKDLSKKLYLDANLQFSLTVPEDWERRFVTTPQYSSAPYTVLWAAQADPEKTDGARVEIRATVMRDKIIDDQQRLANLFTQDLSGFTSTALRPMEDVLFPTLELLGHTPARTYRVIFIQAPDHLYQFSFSTPPEYYEGFRPLFDMVLFSFTPLED